MALRPQSSQARRVLPAAILALALGFAFAPVERQTVTYEWDPDRDGDRVALLLIERTPDSFSLSIDCASETPDGVTVFASSRRLEDPDTLRVTRGPGYIRAEARDPATGERTHSTVATPDGDGCEAALSFDRTTNDLRLSSTIDEAAVLATFEITGLHRLRSEDASVSRLSARIETSPLSAARNSRLQKSLLALMVPLLALLLLREHRAPTGLVNERRQSASRTWNLTDTVASAAGLLVMLIDTPKFDDGRILGRTRQPNHSVFTNTVSTMFESTSLPQRGASEALLAVFTTRFDTVLGLRALALICTVLAWWIFRRFVLSVLVPRKEQASRLPEWAALAAFLAFVSAFGAILRPEPFIVLLIISNLAVVAHWRHLRMFFRYFAVGVVAGMALATHVVGIAAGLVVLPRLTSDLRSDMKERPDAVISGTITAGAVAASIALLGQNAVQAVWSIRNFQDATTSNSKGPLEFLEYVVRVLNGTSTLRLSIFLAFLGWLFVLAAGARALDRSDTPDEARRILLLGVLILPASLVFTTSKLPWHLAILAPVAMFGLAVLAEGLRQRRRPQVIHVSIHVVLGLGMAWALSPAWRSPISASWQGTMTRRVSSAFWQNRIPSLAGPETQWTRWVLILVAAGAVFVIGWQRWGPSNRSADSQSFAVTVTLALCVALVTQIQHLPPVIDAAASPQQWTFVRQSVVGLWDEEARCGVSHATPEVREYLMAIETGANGSDRPIIGVDSRGGLLVPCFATMAQHEGVWVIPDVVMGDLQHGQRRLLSEFDRELIACHDFPNDSADGRLCFSRLSGETSRTRLEPSDVVWKVPSSASSDGLRSRLP